MADNSPGQERIGGGDDGMILREAVRSIAEGLDVPNLAARILYGRGIVGPEEARRLLNPKLEHLSDPFLLPDMERGVERIISAVKSNEKLCLYGDYDADGVTSVALMVNFLKNVGLTPHVYLPQRTEGYGLNIDAVKRLSEQGISLLVCLDCGSADIEEVAEATRHSMDTIIIDHHEVSEARPPALAFINPKRADSRFPTRELAACGVTFFFLLALRRTMHHQGLLNRQINLKKELDLVTVGTIGDMAPLVDDNRVMVKFGMETMKKNPRTWLRSFFTERIIYKDTIDEYAMNFVIVPRINAAGRVSDARHALDFLTCEDERDAAIMLRGLHEINRKRQRIEEGTVREIIEIMEKENLAHKKSIVLFNKDWHIGVIGIVAQKLVDMFGKPSIILTEAGSHLKGSGRGGEGIDLYRTISSLAPLLLGYGGHKYACGVSLTKDNFLPFAQAFEERVTAPVSRREKKVRVDAVAGFEELTIDLLRFMERLSPFGMGNPRPNLLLPSSSVSATDRLVRITDTSNRTWYGSFQGQRLTAHDRPARIVASPVLRKQMGEQFIHLNIKEILPLDEAAPSRPRTG
ncbi:single-stranded-DNA-specific exonuclease RecJ [Syntrophorhabdus aromaticivorans]|uniref:Single-stranded-DNA-specific exonuclease RecJ n=1 Tax=Syntrophorhabdus aromaticivorans TaxID=328301 RepID=A0A971S1J8_9BACT|nr:single-stranded-DNA-specific exonuclease RecJ [Syntrophorhabdus aromaticivorans]NLW35312.1 single-stranded-DNA-specific exonuclease RecJ [Syntrophorhabdus aromaticivorans]